jgi:hypothetical protein
MWRESIVAVWTVTTGKPNQSGDVRAHRWPYFDHVTMLVAISCDMALIWSCDHLGHLLIMWPCWLPYVCHVIQPWFDHVIILAGWLVFWSVLIVEVRSHWSLLGLRWSDLLLVSILILILNKMSKLSCLCFARCSWMWDKTSEYNSYLAYLLYRWHCEVHLKSFKLMILDGFLFCQLLWQLIHTERKRSPLNGENNR